MNTTLIYTVLLTFALACIAITVIPERLFSKGTTEDRVVTKKGFYKKVVLIAGAVTIFIILLVDSIFI